MRGNCRAAPASARGTGRTAYTKDVRRTNQIFGVRTFSMKLRVRDAQRVADSWAADAE